MKEEKKGSDDRGNLQGIHCAVSFSFHLPHIFLVFPVTIPTMLCSWCCFSTSANSLAIMSACGKPEFPLSELPRIHHIIYSYIHRHLFHCLSVFRIHRLCMIFSALENVACHWNLPLISPFYFIHLPPYHQDGASHKKTLSNHIILISQERWEDCENRK